MEYVSPGAKIEFGYAENMTDALISAFKCLPNWEIENMTIPEMKAKMTMMLKLFNNEDVELDVARLEEKVLTEIERKINYKWYN